MDAFKLIQMVMKPEQLKTRVLGLLTEDNARTLTSMTAASAALGLAAMGAHAMATTTKPMKAPLLWAQHQHGDLWQEYTKLRRTLRPKLRGVLDQTVRRPLEWLMVMQSSSQAHFHANTVASATRRLRTAEDGLLTVVGVSGVPWSVRTEAGHGATRRVLMPAQERPARAVQLLRTAAQVMYRNVVQLCRASMMHNALRRRYNSSLDDGIASDASEPIATPLRRVKPWDTAHDPGQAASRGAATARNAQSRDEYIKATAHARIMRRLQMAQANT